MFFLLSCIAFSIALVSAAILFAGLKMMRRLGDTPAGSCTVGPPVSIIVPACNEAQNIAVALESFFAQSYERLEIIVVNDRSTDNTAEILVGLQSRYGRLKVKQIDSLPVGWMGKSHALAEGAALASGEYLLFTDADVVLEKSTIARTIAYMTTKQLDHLTLIFKNVTPGWLLNSLIIEIGMSFLQLFRPWSAREKTSRTFVGIGAFNMVKRSVYNRIGGHEGFKMHPIDDMMLGKTIKRCGFSQDCLLAYEFVHIPWYDSLWAMISGLQKNMFALVHYRLSLIPVLIAAIIVLNILPFWGAILGDKPIRIVCALTVACRLLSFGKMLRLQGLAGWYLPGFVVTPYISCYIILKASFGTIRNKGIFWRGQHYSLNQLRKTQPFLF